MAQQVVSFREIKNKCNERCNQECKGVDDYGSYGGKGYCVNECLDKCYYEELMKVNPCLATCADVCKVLFDLFDNKMTMEKFECIKKCKEAICS